MQSRKLSLGLLLLSVVVYAAALVQEEAFCVDGQCANWPGYAILLFGALALGDNPANLAWLANPLLLVAWIATWLGRRALAVIAGLAALALAVSFFFAGTVITNEAGIANPVTGMRLGYWLWLASGAMASVAALLAGKPPTNRTREP